MKWVLLSALLFSVHATAFADYVQPRSVSEDEKEKMKPVEISGETLFENDNSKTVLTPEGHFFRVAKDRSIEKVGGLVQPVEMDAYVYQKFEELHDYMDQRFGLLDLHLTAIEKKISELKTLLQKPPEENAAR